MSPLRAAPLLAGMLLAGMLFGGGCSGPGADSGGPAVDAVAAEDCTEERWVGAWTTAPSDTTTVLGGQSLRMVLTPLRGGDELRVQLSNRFGAGPVEIESVHVGRVEEGAAIVSGSVQPVAFGGAAGGRVVLAPGEDRWSDPVALSFEAFAPVAVSFHLAGEDVALTRHADSLQVSYVAASEAGDVAGDPGPDAFSQTTTEHVVVTGLDVRAPGTDSVVAAIGDSLTEGVGAVDADARYPDALARRLRDAGATLSPINLGIGGNRVLSDGGLPEFGPSILDRIDPDVLARDDVSDVLLFAGINDLGIPPGATADEVLDGLASVVAALRAPRDGRAGPQVTVATLTPAGTATGIYAGHAAAEDDRQAINAAIRAGEVGDAVVDFDAAVRDPADPSRIAPDLDAGDGLHLNAEGYARLADAVDLDALAGRHCR